MPPDPLAAETPAPGFADPARDAAQAFRALLEALARPGRPATLGAGLAPPAPLSPAAGAALLTLVDADAPVWLPPRLRGGAVEAWLRFHGSAAPAATPAAAAFAYGAWSEIAPEIDALPAGTPAYPDRSATLLLEVPARAPETGPRLTGPGIEVAARLGAELPADFWAARAAQPFPLGRDVFLFYGGTAVGLPRTTQAEI